MSKQRHRRRSQGETTPETTPQTASEVAHFSVSEVVQFWMSVDTKVMVDALHVAARTDDLAAVERYLRRQLRRGELNLTALRDHYGLRPPRAWRPCPSSTSPNTPSAAMTNSWLEPPSRPALETALPSVLKQLKLPQFRSQWQAAEQQATADGWSPASYLYVLAEQEHQQRHQARQRRLLHEAQLPVPKTLADYDWNAIPDLERPQIEQLAHDTGWLDRAENLLLFGPSGVGKTHLAAGICRSLIALDRSARFFSATTLVQELQRAKADYALAKALNRLDRYALLVIDDNRFAEAKGYGYVRKDEAETSVLFELVMHR
jgi:DNA replication protein DnaC